MRALIAGLLSRHGSFTLHLCILEDLISSYNTTKHNFSFWFLQNTICIVSNSFKQLTIETKTRVNIKSSLLSFLKSRKILLLGVVRILPRTNYWLLYQDKWMKYLNPSHTGGLFHDQMVFSVMLIYVYLRKKISHDEKFIMKQWECWLKLNDIFSCFGIFFF